jgi:cell division protein FtsL
MQQIEESTQIKRRWKRKPGPISQWSTVVKVILVLIIAASIACIVIILRVFGK